jgi:pepF/M3 family oligoendopeptidase
MPGRKAMTDDRRSFPRWDLSNVYPDLGSSEFTADVARLRGMLDELDAFLERNGIGAVPGTPAEASVLAPVMDELIDRLGTAQGLLATLGAFVSGIVTTDSYNQEAARKLSELEQLEVRLRRALTRFTAYAGSLRGLLDAICLRGAVAADHRLVLDDAAGQARFLMPEGMEDLAGDLLLSGGGSMWKLQGTVTSRLKMPFDRDGKVQELPVTMIRNLAQDPSEDVRRRAYEAELKAWESVREPVAFALNGVKGSAITLAQRRGYRDVLHMSLEQNRMDAETLEALLGSIQDHLPVFHRYLAAKARRLGQTTLPWWNLLAPMGTVQLQYTWRETQDFIVDRFGSFSGEMADFALRAFENRWIDAEPRDGKRGGAFCMDVPGVEESRILCNFDGSFDQLTTVAHELGHGFHNWCQRGLPMLKRGAPMTLAETASIFCETVIFNAAIESAPADARVAILENQLLGATQVCVDIYTRVLFESEVLKRRAEAELSADEFCELMLEMQRRVYGEVLDPDHLHPYMWLMKPHYYQVDRNFYNYPYAFGQLFGLGMYALYRREGSVFVPRYVELLRSTGAGKVSDLAARFGIEVRSRDFWTASLRIIEEQVDRYAEGV